MTRAIITCMHAYTPFGSEYYIPLFDNFLNQLKKYEKEWDTVYIIEDSNWKLPDRGLPEKYRFVTVDVHLRYFDAYKFILPHVTESAILLMDSDMVVYKPKIIEDTFEFLREGYSVVSIYDTIGKTFEEMGGKSKVCPYWFCTRKELLMRYRDVDWSPDKMPDYETFGQLTEAMIKDRVHMYEWPEDKNSIYIDGRQDEKQDLGYYHIRSGSVPAYLLATKKYGNYDTYVEYLQNQPSQEYHRQMAWYQYMGGDPSPILKDTRVSPDDWGNYMNKFKKFHGLV
jgi:hypothetical protein